MRQTARQMLRGLVPPASAIRLAQTDAPVVDAHFDALVCRNCGAPRATPHCGACGQKAAARFSLRDVWQEFWQSRRWFELSFLHAALRLARAPGAREARWAHLLCGEVAADAGAAPAGEAGVSAGEIAALKAEQARLAGQLERLQQWAQRVGAELGIEPP